MDDLLRISIRLLFLFIFFISANPPRLSTNTTKKRTVQNNKPEVRVVVKGRFAACVCSRSLNLRVFLRWCPTVRPFSSGCCLVFFGDVIHGGALLKHPACTSSPRGRGWRRGGGGGAKLTGRSMTNNLRGREGSRSASHQLSLHK